MAQYVASIDQGTTSTRCMIFDHSGSVVAVSQMEHEQIFPRAGWVEHNAVEIWNNTKEVLADAVGRANTSPGDVAAVGITNQRETALVWDRTTGEPVYNAIVWQDTRVSDDVQAFADRYVPRVEPHRWHQRWEARHRCDERQPNAADGSADAGMGSRTARAV